MNIYNEDLKQLGDLISSIILDEFNNPKNLKTDNGKLIKKFNNIKPKKNEWTIISGIVAIIEKNDSKKRKFDENEISNEKEIIPLTITTGLKTIPDIKFQNTTKGRLLHDLHAEILSIRLFNYLLLKEIEFFKIKNESKLIEFDNNSNLFKLKKGISLAMYISEPPCGDCSLEYLKSNLENKESWNSDGNNNDNDNDNNNDKNKSIRGREFFNELGKVRTKPGRKDSPISNCKSCSDKLSLRQFKSLLNSVNSNLFDLNSFYLKYLILPIDKINKNDLQRCFYDRLIKIEIFKKLPFNPITIIPTSNKFEFDKSINLNKTSDISIIYSPFMKKFESCVKGIKIGCNVNNKPFIKFEDQCFISRESIFKLFLNLQIINKDNNIQLNYYEFKKSNVKRTDLIKLVKSKIFIGWSDGIYDNFTIEN